MVKRKKKLILKNQNNPSSYSAGSLVDAIYKNNPKEEFLGLSEHGYRFTIPEEEADRLGYYPDERGHRDDRVKLESHPTHPSRGTFDGLYRYNLTDKGLNDVNYTLFGVTDGGQDPQATLYYNGSIVLPEITVSSQGNYIMNPYDNIKLMLSHKKGGGIHIKPENKGKFTETKKRTGKSTEELTHSKNPLTRKRAIFALNAKKWKHLLGGHFLGIATDNGIMVSKDKNVSKSKKKVKLVKKNK